VSHLIWRLTCALFFSVTLLGLTSSRLLAQQTRAGSSSPLGALHTRLTVGDTLHLLISHAELPPFKPSGAPWDYGSGAPDAFLSVRYPQRLRPSHNETLPWDHASSRVTLESALIRDELLPVWLFSLSFVDLTEVAHEGVEVAIYDQDPIGRQLIDHLTIPAPSHLQIGQLLSLTGPEGATLYFEWRALARARQVTDVTPIAPVDRRVLRATSSSDPRPIVASDHREAQRLYRTYVKAQLMGDHLGAQTALLQLTQRYANTRYGRKALRLLAPLAR